MASWSADSERHNIYWMIYHRLMCFLRAQDELELVENDKIFTDAQL